MRHFCIFVSSSFGFICATVQVGGGLFRIGQDLESVQTLVATRLVASPARIPHRRDSSLYFLRTGLYASGVPQPFGRQKATHNLQIGEVIDAIAQTEPELFGKSSATLMPVVYSNSLSIPICDAHIANWMPHDHTLKDRE